MLTTVRDSRRLERLGGLDRGHKESLRDAMFSYLMLFPAVVPFVIWVLSRKTRLSWWRAVVALSACALGGYLAGLAAIPLVEMSGDVNVRAAIFGASVLIGAAIALIPVGVADRTAHS